MIKLILILAALSFLPLDFWLSSISAFFILSFCFSFKLYSPFFLISNSSNLFIIDQLNSTLITLSLWIAALMLISSYKIYITHKSKNYFVFYIVVLTLILILCFASSNILFFYIIFEASLIPTFLLIMGWGYQPERLQASFYLLIYTISASLPLLLSISWIFKDHGSIFMISSPIFISLRSSSSLWWYITIFAFIVKIPLYFVHLWLPKAHVEAPVAGSIILAGILLKLGGYGLLRISSLAMPLSFSLRPFFSSLGICGAVITRLICIRQSDLKSLIAYSSVGHMALVVLGVIVSRSWGWAGALIIILAHGLCSSCLFALANLTYDITSTRRIFLTKGLLSLLPAFSLWWFLLSICNIAAPPSINLLGEISIILRSLWTSLYLILPLGLCRFLACAYSLFLYTSTNHGPSSFLAFPGSPFTFLSNSLVVFHFFPIWALIVAPHLISIWL